MKSTRAFVMIGIAFLIAAAAVVLAFQWVSRHTSLATRHIAVAAVDIEIGGRISREMVRTVQWPATSLPAGAVNDPDALVERVARTTILKGEPVLESKLAPVGTMGGLSAIVADGKRAMTVRVNDVVGVAGFALPGNYVDIMVNTFEDGAGSTHNKDRSVSKIVLEHILVLAVAQEAGRDETKPKVVNAVTLEVSPEQAELLDLARSVGTLSLVLRNQVDPKAVQTVGATKDKLLGQRRPAPAPVAMQAVKPAVARPAPKPQQEQLAAAPQKCIAVVTGTQVSRECF